jgi:lysozyme-like protein
MPRGLLPRAYTTAWNTQENRLTIRRNGADETPWGMLPGVAEYPLPMEISHAAYPWTFRLALYRLQPLDVCPNALRVMNARQIHLEWTSAGGSPHDADIATAIALAESHGRITAWNTSDPYGGSVGLWQINGCWKNKFNFHRLHHDPFINAQAAVYVHRVSGWSAWSTYNNGTYLRYMHATRYRSYHKVHHAYLHAPPVDISYSASIGFIGYAVVLCSLARKLRNACIAPRRNLRGKPYPRPKALRRSANRAR